MRIICDKNIELDKATAVTLGNFDGIHLGHQKLIETVKKYSVEEDLASVAFSFYPHPVSVVKPNNQFYTIFTQEEKKFIMEQLKIDVLIQYPFTKEFSSLEAEEFIELLYKMTKLKVLVVGEDYCFGKNRKGNFDLLKAYGDKLGFKAIKIPSVKLGGERVSSTRIRGCINDRNFKEATQLLNKPYFVMGKVCHGKKIGRTIGFPTANVICEDEKLLPPDGVYATKTICRGKIYESITNIGKNPTVNGTQRTVETYFFNFEEDIYGEEIRVLFVDWLRGETKFNNIDELKEQISRDKKSALKIFKN